MVTFFVYEGVTLLIQAGVVSYAVVVWLFFFHVGSIFLFCLVKTRVTTNKVIFVFIFVTT
jgi:hypothetical protein